MPGQFRQTTPQAAVSLLHRQYSEILYDESPFGNLPLLFKQYLAGQRITFSQGLDLRGATSFQQAVWKATSAIPYGETRSYSWVAERIGKPLAARAVGQALGRNPVPIIVPCHRVIASEGDLGGFSGGLELKRLLLEIEDRTL